MVRLGRIVIRIRYGAQVFKIKIQDTYSLQFTLPSAPQLVSNIGGRGKSSKMITVKIIFDSDVDI